MPAHYKPHNQYTAQYSHRQSASNHFEPHLSSPWSTKHQLPSSPYAPSAFANMVGSFAMPLTPRPVHSTDWNRSTALPHRFKSHNSKNSDIAQPSTHAYISPPSPPTMMAGSSYPLRSGSASDSTSSTTISSTSGGNEAVWSPLRDWTEGASTVNRNRLLGTLNPYIAEQVLHKMCQADSIDHRLLPSK